jgi:uncharacterized circularly permuted ATP-grasp superfamily protein
VASSAPRARAAPSRRCDLIAPASPAEAWNSLLRPEIELAEPFWAELSARLRAAKLTFGGRVHCPFLRPLFLSRQDVGRITRVAEAIAAVGERVVQAALADHTIFDAVGLTDDERRLVSIDPGYSRASTASRLDGFLLPDDLWFAEYNAESPAGLGYTETLARIFSDLPVMARFRERFEADYFRLGNAIVDALLASYREWGGLASPPTVLIVDFRGVPTWSEFEILQNRFEGRGLPTVVADPRDLVYENGRLLAAGRAIDLVYRRVLMNDILAHTDDCAALVRAYADRAVCVANTFRCKIPHKKAFFAVLTGEAHQHLLTPDEQALVRAHVPWTRLIAPTRTRIDGQQVDLLEHLRRRRDEFVIKPNDEFGGAGVVLGWETDEAAWTAAIDRAVASGAGAWVAQRRIPVSRQVFPMVDTPHAVVMRDMLVDLAPYLFRGRVAGFLTRLSTTGLANVTSGGGQIPSFVVEPREA